MINQLQIGNWVEVFFTEDEVGYGKDFYGQIIAIINPSKVMVKEDLHYHPIDHIRRIPITDAILLKAGLIKDNYGIFIKYRNNKAAHGEKIDFWIKQYIKNDKETWDVCIGDDFSNLFSFGNIDYVDELQNLSYFLCDRNALPIQL